MQKKERQEQTGRIVIGERDYEALEGLIERDHSPAAQALEKELERAEIVEGIPEGAVFMNSRVTFRDLDSGEESTITLVYPGEAEVASMRISVLSPVGSALIGLRVNGTIDWPVSTCRVRRLQVVKVEARE